MKILIDATSIVNQPTGAGRYSYHILNNLSKIDNQNEYTVIVNKHLSNTHPIFDCRNFNFIKLDIATIGIKRDIFLSLFLFFNRKKFDIFYCLMPYLPYFYTLKKSIITIHDLGYFWHPEYLSKMNFFYLKHIIKHAVKKSIFIITPSESSRDDIVSFFNVLIKKIKKVYMDSTFLELNCFTEESSVFDFSYFLYVGERRPHKNLENLIKAFGLFKNNNLSEIKLVLVGKDYKNYTKKLRHLINNLNLENDILILDPVSDKKLCCYYRGALALLLVSYYEGFGLPLVEAMKLGIPIIASNISIMKEITDGNALFADPDNINDIAEKMVVLVSSSNIKKELINNSKMRSYAFSWEKSCEEILSILND